MSSSPPAAPPPPSHPQPEPVRFGIMACATIARKVSRAILLAPSAAVAAVGSRSEAKARAFAAAAGLAAPRLHGSYEALLEDPGVDAVYLPLPTSLHLRWATAAAAMGKHVLLEKPTALCAADLDAILAACDAAGAQFLNNDIRVKPDLDALGALGDAGWYCIRAILWAVDYELPNTVIALCNPVRNQAGILACGTTLYWADGKIAIFNCSFLGNLCMDMTIIGTNGMLHVTDFVIPYEEKSAPFDMATKSKLVKLEIGWDPLPSKHVIPADLPQEVLMIQEFSRLVQNIRDSSGKPDEKWPAITRKTQVVMDAVKTSIDNEFGPVDISC
uniref:Gfo/Idh/MocA-like oxidoreductase N-terminal domain-containing protein n=1 Tax=Leersia perrieri TaxID=77586 RepID=A0A0D9XJG8_9ORYZ